ncbi:MAG: carboxypeptidase regulatory-like domain-containing protein [Myxococcota bacterium]
MRPFSRSVLFVAVLGTGCNCLGPVVPPVVMPDAAFQLGSRLTGWVRDRDGTSLANVEVSFRGALTTRTDGNGAFTLDLPPGLEQPVRLRRDGYVTVVRRVNLFEDVTTYLEVRLATEAAPVPLDATHGGAVTGPRGAQLVAPAGAFVDENGQTASGTVDVSLTAYDPSNDAELSAYPLDLFGEERGGDQVQLETFGVLNVEVRQAGRALQVASGKTVELHIPAPASGPRPATARLWRGDETQGIWLEQGPATLDEQSGTYVATTDHLSPHNVDEVLDPYCLRGMVEDHNGQPARGAIVDMRGVDYAGGSVDFTDGDGSFCMTVKQRARVRITIRTRDDQTTREVQTGDERSTLPPTCNMTRCRDLGTIHLGQPAPDGGVAADSCEDSLTEGNPFDGTCADALGDFFTCFSPQGPCYYDMDDFQGESFTISYGNGAKVEYTFNDITGVVTGTYHGPGGAECGTMTMTETSMELTPRGSTGGYRLESTARGGVVVVCPSGFRLTLDGDQRESFSSCSGDTVGAGSGEGGATACEPAPGTRGARCQNVLDCNSPNTCCQAHGQGLCLSSDECETYRDYGCTSDVECELGRCCQAGIYKMCLMSDVCY